ncbi:SMI1/KNR4 family protein [Paenibacillus sp.]|uniref:SMI1/KNR4 family protein n=1 Tax=Paenibacillus sp. TaxID=58172 RepID=UPI00283AB420|nr:SMI1/KNR4 family protein [Paenibacillus sp.]
MQSITVLEQILNVKFPNKFGEKMEYISKTIHGGNKLVLNNASDSISIIKVLEFDSEKEESIFQVYTEFKDLMKDGSIPIANAGYDDYICLYFVDRKLPPKVILWCYERAFESIDYAIFPLADTFEEFIEKVEQVDI